MTLKISEYVDPYDFSTLYYDGSNLIEPKSKREYPIVNNIPRFIPSKSYADAFGLQWNQHTKTQLDSYTGTSITEDRLRIALGGDLESLRGKKVLEAGSGAGRFTEILLKHGAIVHSFDLSNAVEANYLNNFDKSGSFIFQADINKLPLKKCSFDYVICLGVVQHTPNTEATIVKLIEYVKQGGVFVFDHYKLAFGQFTSLYLVYWLFIRMLPSKSQFKVTNFLTRFFFPIHWKFRENKTIQKLLNRITPINFYYGGYPLATKQLHFEWSLLDTHDRNTDYYKRNIRKTTLVKYFKRNNITQYTIEIGGTGYLARLVR